MNMRAGKFGFVDGTNSLVQPDRMKSIPPYLLAQCSPDRLWDWIIRTEPLVVAEIEPQEDGRLQIKFSRNAEGRVEPAVLRRWAAEMMGEWNAVTEGAFCPAVSSDYEFVSEPGPAYFICRDRFDKFHALLSLKPVPFWIMVEPGDRQGAAIPFSGSSEPSADAVARLWQWYRQILISEFVIVADWTEVKHGNQYTPNGDEVVWTTDGNEVRKGRFILDAKTLTGRAEGDPDWWKIPGQWLDESGQEVKVTHWLWLDQWKENFPPPAPPSVIEPAPAV
jgi:hypothetical protein